MFKVMSAKDRAMVSQLIGGLRDPDLTISPDGNPYLYRWNVLPPRGPANVFLHMQVASDPRKELHDHPWDNSTVMLSGSYNEFLDPDPKRPRSRGPGGFVRSTGDVIFRRAEWSHRLILTTPYALTLFSTGPKIRDWGYWFADGWHHNKRHNSLVDGVATFQEEMGP